VVGHVLADGCQRVARTGSKFPLTAGDTQLALPAVTSVMPLGASVQSDGLLTLLSPDARAYYAERTGRSGCVAERSAGSLENV
jgi:hypothetical protein